MSPTYNDHFRQATKKVTKNICFKCRRISLEVAGGCYYFTTFAMSHSVDWATFKPYWKTVATSTSSDVTIPAGYRLYRVRLCGNKTSTNSWGAIGCSQATGTTWIYIQGMSAGNWIADERGVTASSDKAIMDGARHSTPAGFQTWDITISKPSKTGNVYIATWETGMNGSKTFNTGRSVFNVTNGTADMTLYSELSSALWSVEAFVEN